MLGCVYYVLNDQNRSRRLHGSMITITEAIRRPYGYMDGGGRFCEIYGRSHDDPQIVVCAELNLTATRRNNNIVDSPLMAGFPSHSTKKYAQAMTQKGYTIVLVTQVSPPPNVVRKVMQILSPHQPQHGGPLGAVFAVARAARRRLLRLAGVVRHQRASSASTSCCDEASTCVTPRRASVLCTA